MSIPAHSSPRPQAPPRAYKQCGPCRLSRYLSRQRNKQSGEERRGGGCAGKASKSASIRFDSRKARTKPACAPVVPFIQTTHPPMTALSHPPSSNYIRRVSSLSGTKSSLSARKRQGINSPCLYESLVPLLAWPPARPRLGRRKQASEWVGGRWVRGQARRLGV